MGKRVLSIDISRTLVKVCEVDFESKSSKVYKCFTLKTPEGAFEEGFIAETQEFGQFLRKKFFEYDVKAKQIVFSITSAKIANREVLIPYVKEKQIAAVVKANARDYFPVDISGYQVAHSVLDEVVNENGKQRKLMVLAAPKPLIDSYYKLAESIGMPVVAIDYSGNSIIPVVREAISAEPTMVIKVDEHATLLTVLKNKAVVLQRTLTQGADIAVETMMDLDAFGKNLTEEEALEILRGKTCIRKTFDETVIENEDKDDDEKIFRAKIELTDSLRSLVASIVRVVDYYNSRNAEEPIKKLLLTGFGGDFSGLSKLLSSEIGEKVKVLAHVDGIVLDKSVTSARVSFGEYIACIGAAKAPVDLIPDERKPKKKGLDMNTSVDMTVVSALVLAGGLLVAIVLAGTALLTYHDSSTENKRLNNRIEDLEPIIPIYNEYTNATLLHQDVVTMYDLTQNNNENIRAFMEELQKKMPASIAIQSFESSASSIIMTMYLDEKEDIGSVVEQLRTFDSLSDVVFTGSSLTQNEAGESVWSLSMQATYKAMESIDADADEEEGTEE